MSPRWLRAACIALAVLLAATALARPRKVLVLPLGGDADPQTRTHLKASIGRLARQIDGTVSVGDVTFLDTAAAVGCDPESPKCVDDVLAALSVDELVWGSATTRDGKVTITLRRATKGAAPREITATIAADDAPERAEPGLQPLFSPPLDDREPTGSSTEGSAAPPTDTGSAAGSAEITAPLTGSAATLPPGPAYPSHKRNLGIGLSVGGGIALVLGVALWASESSMQTQIDHHDTDSSEDIKDLRALEDRASARAWEGNVMVAAGLAIGGYGAYLLYKDHKERAHAQLAPAPPPGAGAGMTLVLRGIW